MIGISYEHDVAVSFAGAQKVYGGSSARFVMPFLSAEYFATPYSQDELAAAVEQGFPDHDQVLWIIRTADPASHDSNREPKFDVPTEPNC